MSARPRLTQSTACIDELGIAVAHVALLVLLVSRTKGSRRRPVLYALHLTGIEMAILSERNRAANLSIYKSASTTAKPPQKRKY